jgi:acyl carrier protein
MFKSWKPVPISDTAYGITFTSAEQLQIANSLESRFGITFELSKQELEQSLKTINRLATQFLSK